MSLFKLAICIVRNSVACSVAEYLLSMLIHFRKTFVVGFIVEIAHDHNIGFRISGQKRIREMFQGCSIFQGAVVLFLWRLQYAISNDSQRDEKYLFWHPKASHTGPNGF